MFLPRSISRRRGFHRPARRDAGLSLIEVLTTLLLIGLAFVLIARLAMVQSTVSRQQQVKDRFLVDCDALVQLLSEDLSSAFLVKPTIGSTIIEIGHLALAHQLEPGPYPFSQEPYRTMAATSPPEPELRGRPYHTAYTLIGQDLHRASREIALPAPYPPPQIAGPFSNNLVLGGLSGASVSVNGASVELELSIASDQKVHRLSRFLFAPGVMP